MVKLQESKKGSFNITLPKDLIIKKRWKKGQEFLIMFNEHGDLVFHEIKKGVLNNE